MTAQTSQDSSLPEGTVHDQSSDEPVVLQRAFQSNEHVAIGLSESRHTIGQQE